MRKTRRLKRIALGCGGIIGLLIFIGIVGAITGQGNAQQGGATPTATSAVIVVASTPTSIPTRAVTIQSTRTIAKPSPTLQPTHQVTPVPTQRATPKPTPKPTQPTCQAVNNNPWCYNFSSGNLIYTPPSNFCSYFNCISSFWGADDPGDGYVVQCQDGTFSQSGGESGACSYHGGVLRPLYSH